LNYNPLFFQNPYIKIINCNYLCFGAGAEGKIHSRRCRSFYGLRPSSVVCHCNTVLRELCRIYRLVLLTELGGLLKFICLVTIPKWPPNWTKFCVFCTVNVSKLYRCSALHRRNGILIYMAPHVSALQSCNRRTDIQETDT
jgi:hypothetical protein